MRQIQGRLRVGALLVAIAALAAGPTAPSAASQLPIVCQGAGAVEVSADPVTKIATWIVAGKGSCLGDMGGTYFVDFQGIGSSRGLGLCTQTTVIDLNIAMTVALTSFSTGVTQVILERWAAPETTFPVATPFVIHKNGNPLGAGVIATRIFGNCPPEGTPAAWIDWTQTH